MGRGSHFTVMDLVSVFGDEADKICMNKRVAHMIALDALNDYVKGWRTPILCTTFN